MKDLWTLCTEEALYTKYLHYIRVAYHKQAKVSGYEQYRSNKKMSDKNPTVFFCIVTHVS